MRAMLLAGDATAAEEYEALVQWRKGDAAGAAGRLAALDARDPWSEFVLSPAYLLAEVSADLRDWRATVAAVERFRSLWPRGMWRAWALPRATYLAALAHAELGERREAREELDRLAGWWRRADPGLPLAHEIRELKGRLEE